MKKSFASGLLTTLMGCVSAIEAAEPSPTDTVPVASGTPVSSSDKSSDKPPAEIVIPMRPASGPYQWWGILAPDSSAAEPTWTLNEARIHLALGDGYPEAMVLDLADLYTSCQGSWEIRELRSSNDTVEARLEGKSKIHLRTTGRAGESMLTLSGQYSEPADCHRALSGSSRPFAANVAVRTLHARRAKLDFPFECADREVERFAISASGSLRPELLDDDGEPFVALNAAYDAPMTLRIRGSAQMLAAADQAPKSITSWKLPSVPGVLEVVPEAGESVTFEVVDAPRIQRSQLDFFHVNARSSEGPALENGEAYARRTLPISPFIVDSFVDGVALCSPSKPGWFELESLTPDVCPIQSARGETGYWAAEIEQVAMVERNGTCTLRVRAPRFNDGAGFEMTWSAQFY